jgi:putative toxin-antitoxin system antitoxin component (TIGR02293 family)
MSSIALTIEQMLDQEISSFLRQSYPDEFVSDTRELTYKEFLSDKILIIKVIREGIPYHIFDLISQNTPFSEKDWAEILGVSTKSLQRYKQAAGRFKPLQSEKIIEMAEVIQLGLDVFEDMEKLSLWLQTPTYSLGNLKPFELLKDSYGKEMVMGELTRINHGILG